MGWRCAVFARVESRSHRTALVTGHLPGGVPGVGEQVRGDLADILPCLFVPAGGEPAADDRHGVVEVLGFGFELFSAVIRN